MEVFEAIKARHSYRGEFTDSPVPREDLKKIVQAGMEAPSGCNAQTTSFVIVDDLSVIKAIAGIVDKPVVRGAKAIIVCVVEHREIFKGMSFGVEDCSAAVENMLLAITALGYATVWIDGNIRGDDRAKKIAALLGIPADREVRIILPMGIPKEPVQAKEKLPFDQRACFNHWRV
jgi:nitroreductase